MDHAGHRHHRSLSSSSSKRLIGLFSPPSIGAGTPASDELNEADVCFSDDFTEHPIASLSSSASSTNASHSRRRLFSPHSGLLAALSASTPSKKIPPSRPILNEIDGAKSAGSKRIQQRSAPVRVPVLASAMADRRKKLSALAEEDSDVEDEEMLPPHEIVARRSGRSMRTTCSMLEGAGRTLKGRDLRQVRNAVWQKTGFLD